MRPERRRQNEFLKTETLAQTTELAIADLETTCVGPSRSLEAMMAQWIDVRPNGDDATTYKLCGVCLGGASLVSREWLDIESQHLLEDVYQHGTDTVMEMLPRELTSRMTAMDHIRMLRVTRAVDEFDQNEYSTADWQKLAKVCDQIQTKLTRASYAAQEDPDKRRETGTNHLWKDSQLTQRELVESIRFFRKIVSPELTKAGI